MEIVFKVEFNPEQMTTLLDLHGKMSKQIANLKGRIKKIEGEVLL